jgi:hypothetical protein
MAPQPAPEPVPQPPPPGRIPFPTGESLTMATSSMSQKSLKSMANNTTGGVALDTLGINLITQ